MCFYKLPFNEQQLDILISFLNEQSLGDSHDKKASVCYL